MGIRNKLRELWWNVKKRTQRFKRGYADMDAWNFFDWFVSTGEPMLRQLQQNHWGFPMSCESDEEWTKLLGEMAEHLHYMDEWNVIDELYNGDYMKTKEINATIDEHKTKFFELFSRYFYDLWD